MNGISEALFFGSLFLNLGCFVDRAIRINLTCDELLPITYILSAKIIFFIVIICMFV